MCANDYQALIHGRRWKVTPEQYGTGFYIEPAEPSNGTVLTAAGEWKDWGTFKRFETEGEAREFAERIAK